MNEELELSVLMREYPNEKIRALSVREYLKELRLKKKGDNGIQADNAKRHELYTSDNV
ncbi:MAG: hypothetical protein LBS38_02755 [Endomicrobium sp.]|jgi:hypothetical protein|nr:hypothetical protein [Endomicrobium sp.]